jgi:hypothetical protein
MSRLITFSIYLLVIIGACYKVVYSQNVEIIFDYSTGEITSKYLTGEDTSKCLPLTVPEGYYVRYRLNNVNPFHYDIRINQKQYSIQAPSIAFFSGDLTKGNIDVSSLNQVKPEKLLINTFNEIALKYVSPGTKKPKNKPNEDETAKAIINKFGQDVESFRKAISNYDLCLALLNDFLKFGKDIDTLIQSDHIDGEYIINNIKHQISKLFKINIEAIPSITIQDFRDKSDTLFDDVKSKYNEIPKANEILISDSINMEKIAKNLSCKCYVDTLNAEMNNARKIYNQRTDSYNKLMKIGRDSCESQAENGGNLYFSIITETFERSLNIQATNSTDIIRFSPLLIPKNNNKDSIKNFADYEVIVTNGWRLDYSTGIIISGLKDDSYGVIDTTYMKSKIVNNTSVDSTVKGKYYYKNQKTNISFALVGMMHFYWRCARFLGLGANLGIGLSNGQTSNIQYLGGFSLIVGEDQRFILNIGGIIGSVKRLDDYYKDHSLAETTSNTIPLVDKLTGSWYVGLTYSLGSRKVVTQ